MVRPGPGLGPSLRVLGVCSGRWVPSYLGVGAMCPPPRLGHTQGR